MNGISPSSCRGDLQLSQCPVCSKPDFWQACLSSSASCWPRSDNLKTESYGAKPARFDQRSNHRKGRHIYFAGTPILFCKRYKTSLLHVCCYVHGGLLSAKCHPFLRKFAQSEVSIAILPNGMDEAFPRFRPQL